MPRRWNWPRWALFPRGAYRNRDFVAGGVCVKGNISRAMEDILFDPQTSGGLLIAVDGDDAEAWFGRPCKVRSRVRRRSDMSQNCRKII